MFRPHVEPADWRGFPVGGFIDERHARQVIKKFINITAEHSENIEDRVKELEKEIKN